MELSVENLDQIRKKLIESYEGIDRFFKQCNFNEHIEISSENRKLLNIMFEQTSSYLLEMSHIESFLQKCDHLLEDLILTATQQENLIFCQQLCQLLKDKAGKVLAWTIQNNKQLNEAACPVLDEAENINLTTKSNCDKVSPTMIETYEQIRIILKKIHADIAMLDPETMLTTAGKHLDVMNGTSLFIETEHEMNVLMDYGLFRCRKNGKNIVERYFDANHTLYAPQKLAILRAFKEAKFSFLEVVNIVEEPGIMVRDHLTNELMLMIDKGFYKFASTLNSKYGVLTHYLVTPQFVMTTGAATPVLLDSFHGKKMWSIFDKLIQHHRNNKLLEADFYNQYITELYKFAIHENIAKKVASRGLPMNYHGINKTYGNMQFN